MKIELADRETYRNIRLDLERQFSIDDIERGSYSHADRDLFFYRALILGLDRIVSDLIELNGKIDVLDVGCGTGRASAELMEKYSPDLDAIGVTLTHHPPIGENKFLPPERVVISSIGNAGFEEDSFHLAYAVGSLDVSHTIFMEGKTVLPLIKPGGMFVLAPTSNGFPVDDPEIHELMAHALALGFETDLAYNTISHPCYYFFKPAQN